MFGSMWTTLCESAVFTGNVRASTPVIYSVNVATKFMQLALPVIKLVGNNTMSTSEEEAAYLRPCHERSTAMDTDTLAFREKKESDDVYMLLHQLAYGNMNDTDPHYSFNSAVVSVIESTLEYAMNIYNDQVSKLVNSLKELASTADSVAGALSVIDSGESLPATVFSNSKTGFAPLPADWSSSKRFDSALIFARSLLLPTYSIDNRRLSHRNILKTSQRT